MSKKTTVLIECAAYPVGPRDWIRARQIRTRPGDRQEVATFAVHRSSILNELFIYSDIVKKPHSGPLYQRMRIC